MVNEHQWNVVGPWYRWESEEDPFSKRFSRPIIQKYPDSSHVNEFLENPQHSLKYLAEDKSPSNRRKIYLDTHSRFYLVVCALHCDTSNFPKVNRDKVCEAGFVVRRRKTQVPDEIKSDVDKLLTNIAYQKSKLKRVQNKHKQVKPKAGGIGLTRAVNIAIDKSKQSAQQKYTLKLEQSQENLKTLLQDFGVEPEVQAWRQTVSGIGLWEKIDEETPDSISEQIYPLYPLIPDSNNDSHPSGHQSLFYGLLPVGSSDTDQLGNPQFDDRSVFELRCFVRRHKPLCPKSNERNDCKGDIVWSRSTETYQLASHFDLVGTANKMTTIQAPDLQALKEQTDDPTFQIGQGLGFAVASPKDSNLPIQIDGDDKPEKGERFGPPSICFFAIPLITIVALFLLRLFLPIIVFLFGLWFLLRLKFCILPSISVDLGVELDVGLEGKLDLGVDLQASLEAQLGAQGVVDFINKLESIKDDMPKTMRDKIDEMSDKEKYRTLARIAIDQSMDFSGSGIAPEIVEELAKDPGLPEVSESQQSSLPNPNDRLQYYDTKQLQEVLL